MAKLKSQLLVLCDFALTSREGKLSIIGIFDRMFVTDLPSKFTRFFIVSTLTGEPESEHNIVLNIVAPSGKQIMDGKQMTIKFGANGRTNTLTDVSNFPLPEVGEYKVQINAGKIVVAESAFNVTKVSSQSDSKTENLPN